MAASIKEFGWTVPILVDGEGTIVAGHGRILAARKLKLSEVPTIDVGHLSDAQRRAYVIADNRLALDAGWDEEMLRVELGDLTGAEFDLALTGFTEAELEAFVLNATTLDEMPKLPDGDKAPIQQMTFTLHDDQVALVKEACDAARALGPFVDTGNENGNGNSLARVAELFLSWGADHGIR
ncbi:MAG: ParB/Srx family N-terminal domain-containing protein [Burkholderiaceae bacterium]